MHLDLLIIYLTKKNSSKSFKWLLRNGVVHVTMNRHTDRRTDREPDTTIFSNTCFRKILDFRSVRFAKRHWKINAGIEDRLIKGHKFIPQCHVDSIHNTQVHYIQSYTSLSQATGQSQHSPATRSRNVGKKIEIHNTSQ